MAVETSAKVLRIVGAFAYINSHMQHSTKLSRMDRVCLSVRHTRDVT